MSTMTKYLICSVFVSIAALPNSFANSNSPQNQASDVNLRTVCNSNVSDPNLILFTQQIALVDWSLAYACPLNTLTRAQTTVNKTIAAYKSSYQSLVVEIKNNFSPFKYWPLRTQRRYLSDKIFSFQRTKRNLQRLIDDQRSDRRSLSAYCQSHNYSKRLSEIADGYLARVQNCDLVDARYLQFLAIKEMGNAIMDFNRNHRYEAEAFLDAEKKYWQEMKKRPDFEFEQFSAAADFFTRYIDQRN